MIDTHIPLLDDDSTSSARAVNYILQRVARDRDFSWHMWGTQTLSLCLAAEAERLGCTEQDMESWLKDQTRKWDPILVAHNAGESRETVLQRRIDKLETLVEVDPDDIPVEIHWRDPPEDRCWRCDCPRLYTLAEREIHLCDSCFSEALDQRREMVGGDHGT